MSRLHKVLDGMTTICVMVMLIAMTAKLCLWAFS